MDKIMEAVKYIKSKKDCTVDAAIILGSGLGDLADQIEDAISIRYSDIPNFPVSTVTGHAGRMVIGSIGNKMILAMQGRFHFYEGYSMQEVVFPIRVFNQLGIKKLVLTNAAGGVNINFVPGDLMVITDHINLTMHNPLIGRNLDEIGPRFPDMSQTYNRESIQKLKKIYEKNNVRYVQGTYACFTGPCFETPAEIRMARIIGADAVGMSTVPEAIAARHCGMEVLGISCITNMAAGILDQPLSHEEVMITSNMVKDKFQGIIRDLLADI